MNLTEFLFTVTLVFSVSGFIIFLRHMALSLSGETRKQKRIFIEKSEKNNLTNFQ
jgi:cell division protein FtsL